MKLKRQEDRRALAFIFIQLGLVGLGYATWRLLPGWAIGLHVVATAWFAFLTAVIVHNAVHVPMFVERRHNKLNQLLLSVAFGHPVSVYVRGHNLSHHRFTQTSRDVMRTTKTRSASNLLNQLIFFFVVGPPLARANERYVAKQRAEGSAWYKQLQVERLVVRGFLLVMVVLDWRAAVLFLGLPRLFSNWAIVGTNYFQHDGCDETSPDNHSRNLTGSILNWWGFNNGFHGQHHENPAIHWADLPRAHAEDLGRRAHPNLCQPNALTWALRFYGWPGRRMRYDGTPLVLPEVGEDDDWFPATSEIPAGVSLGAVSE